jgi:hypothetical protein
MDQGCEVLGFTLKSRERTHIRVCHNAVREEAYDAAERPLSLMSLTGGYYHNDPMNIIKKPRGCTRPLAATYFD